MKIENFVNFVKDNKTKLIIADVLTCGGITGVVTATAVATTVAPMLVASSILPPMN